MISFDSPEATTLRALQPSRSALEAIWFTALQDRRDTWVGWAGEQLAQHLAGAEMAALRFVRAASDGETRQAQQIWTILSSFPASDIESRIVRAARDLRASMTF